MSLIPPRETGSRPVRQQKADVLQMLGYVVRVSLVLGSPRHDQPRRADHGDVGRESRHRSCDRYPSRPGRRNVVLLAKTATPHARLDGTVHTAAAQIEAAGGQALAVVGDVRNDLEVERAVDAAVGWFGGLDIVVNNASALDLRSTRDIDMKKYDLMQDINARGTFLLSKAAIPISSAARTRTC